MWETTAGNRVSQNPITGWRRRIAFSPDGKLLAMPSGCGVALRRLPGFTDPLNICGQMDMVPFVGFLSDNHLVSWGRDCKTFLWDIPAAKPVWELSNADNHVPVASGPQAVAVSPQRGLLAVAFRGRGVEIWNTVVRKREKMIPVATGELLRRCNSRRAAIRWPAATWREIFSIFDVQSGRTVRRWSRDEWMRENKGEHRQTEALPLDGDTTISMSVSGDGMEIQSLAWSGDGKVIVSATPRKVRWLEVQTGKLVRQSAGSSERIFKRYVTFSPNGKMLAELDDTMRSVVLDAASGREIWNDKDGDIAFACSTIAFSPDNTLLAGGRGDSVRLVDAATGHERAMVSTGQSDVEGVAFSADGRYLASGGGDGTILVWDIAQVLAFKRRESTDTDAPLTRRERRTKAEREVVHSRSETMIRIANLLNPRPSSPSPAAPSTRKWACNSTSFVTSTRPWGVGWMTSQSATRAMATCIATPATGRNSRGAGEQPKGIMAS